MNYTQQRRYRYHVIKLVHPLFTVSNSHFDGNRTLRRNKQNVELNFNYQRFTLSLAMNHHSRALQHVQLVPDHLDALILWRQPSQIRQPR